MADTQLLKFTAEALQNDLEHSLENEWHGGTEYNRLIYRIERLKMFQEYIELRKEFNK